MQKYLCTAFMSFYLIFSFFFSGEGLVKEIQVLSGARVVG
jgi:hypothetical protein